MSPLIGAIIIVALLITPLITTHEPPSTAQPQTPGFRVPLALGLLQVCKPPRSKPCNPQPKTIVN